MNNSLSTPYFVIDKAELDGAVAKFKAALDKYWPNWIAGYSYKTNSTPWIIEYFRDNGFYAEVVSDDEYDLACAIGCSRKIYNGIIKSKETFLESVKNGDIVNIDSDREIEWLDELVDKTSVKVGIRVNFDIEKMCPGQSQEPEEGGRFGFCYENGELIRAIDKIRSKGVTLAGIHLHQSSKTRSLDIYRAICEVAVKVASEYDLDLEYVDVGGGFFGGLPGKPQYDDYMALMSSILSERFSPDKTALIVEPGMALIGSPISFVTSVTDVKKTSYSTFVVTDGSRCNIDPLMKKTGYFYDTKYADDDREIMDKQIISGYTCMEHDRLFIMENAKELKEGDRIIYHKVGAYTMCLSPLFIKYHPDIYVDDGGNMTLVRPRWDADRIVR